jgi:hypothetical protein
MIHAIQPADVIRSGCRVVSPKRFAATHVTLFGTGTAFGTDIHIELQHPRSIFDCPDGFHHLIQFSLIDRVFLSVHFAFSG